jgi:alpha-glucosidase/alpha-D-xyloside xylohydrolase
VRLYNRALSADEIKMMALGDGKVAVNGLAGWWKLDGDLVNSSATAPKGSIARFRGIDRKWVAKAADLSKAQLDIRAAGEVGVRVTIRPLDFKDTFPYTPALVERENPKPVISLRNLDLDFKPVKAKVGNLNVTVKGKPLSVLVTTQDGKPVQNIAFASDGTMSFALDDQPVLGLGEGGPKQQGNWQEDTIEFDRRGRVHSMNPRYDTKAYGSRNPVAMMVGTSGWGMFVATPWGEIDLTSKDRGTFTPAKPIPPGTVVSRRQQRQGRIGLPPAGSVTPGVYDVFVFDAHQPAKFMKDVSTLTGPAVLPPRWALGYMQSHRTLEDDAQMVGIVDTFRKKQIPLDAVIYLGTGFTPRGWNKYQPSFEFNPAIFKREPKQVLADMHQRNVKVVAHMIPWDRNRLETLHGSIPAKTGEPLDDSHIASYWKQHNALVDAGIDAWWPDEGDWFNFHERMKRHQLYYEGPLSKTPNVRPWSLHRNGHLGVARWGGWVWSGDTHASWKSLEAQVALGINHSLSLSPFWGSDIGGFYPTRELTGELFARWHQFAAFTTSFRGHGRTWQMRLPWGWGLSNMGPKESNTPPLESELNNPKIEPIAKKYTELRYQLLSYNYTLAWQARSSGMPMMRSMWLHYPNDKKARAIGDQYLWGRDLLIAPVYKKGATSREVYLPAGKWYDWWTGEAETGGRTVQRPVDLAIMPIYVRAGAIIPLDPIRQYTNQVVDQPTTLKIYQGADGQTTLYDDDGISLDYLKGASTQTLMKWDDRAKRLTLEPQTSQTSERKFIIKLIPDGTTQEIHYAGKYMELRL